ncbi:MAG: hypothetical protein ABSH06_25165 [Thermodesulfobacteriota bacterium]|jgi:hypothetical protein
MEGKLLWRVIDLLNYFREQQNKLEKQANSKAGNEKYQLGLQAGIYKDAVDRL